MNDYNSYVKQVNSVLEGQAKQNTQGATNWENTPMSKLHPDAVTLRDQFAIAALPAILYSRFVSKEQSAEKAYAIADAMLAERAK